MARRHRTQIERASAERIFFICHTLRAGFTIEEIFNLTKTDHWFQARIKEIVNFEEELATTARQKEKVRVSLFQN